MSLIRLLYMRHRGFIALSIALSVASAVCGVAVIAAINRRLASLTASDLSDFATFAALLAAMFVVGTAAQLAMATLGHTIVWRLRRTMVKRVLDTGIERLESVGLARILATLNSDINTITLAFASVPAMVYGLALTLGGFAYLAWLSPPLFAATAAMLGVAIGGGGLLMSLTRREARLARDLEDELYRHYQSAVDGRKELALNRDRARDVYEREFEPDALRSRHHEIRTDVWNGLNQNFVNTMLLATIGVVLFLAAWRGWAEAGVVATFAFTLLFLRAPITAMVGALPSLVAGSVALAKVDALQLAEYRDGFDDARADLPADWQRLRLCGVGYRYAGGDEPGFGVGPIDLTIKRGEVLFVVGGNGSGKTTLMRLMSGLYQPQEGAICVDDVVVDESRRPQLRALFASVFSDFHLFRRVLGPVDDAAANAWLARLAMGHKARVDGGTLSELKLSQGQRKRLALLVAWAESRPILLLDEWAADQDPAFREFFYRELLPELRAAGRTIVAVSHDDRWFHLADRVVKLDGGRIVEDAAPVIARRATG
jgi:putative ATP-binding cassette transporter